MILRRILPAVVAALFALAGLGAVPCAAATRRATRSGPTPPRLRFIDGAVSFWRTGAADWSTAQVNTALAAGDSLYAGDGANLELQIGPQAFIRAGAATELDLTALDANYMQYRITGGHAAFDLQILAPGQTIEIDTPNAVLNLDRPGYYRIDVADNSTAFSARRGGTATVVPAVGETTTLVDNQQIVLEGTDNVQVTATAAPAPDAWDQWNDARMAQVAEAPRSAQYVPPQVAGADDLDRYGDWSEQPQYGHVWTPRGVGSDWAPYSTGRWVYDPYYQWTWVDEAPWGWAPYHYGRWVNYNGGWGWAPGPVVVAPVYSPALVAFFGAPGIGVSVGVGLPFVSWVAQGFGEPVVPWWGGSGFVGRPYWGGWGGPHVINNTVINNTQIVNVTNINNYGNVHVRNAVMGVDRNQFGRGRIEHVPLDAQQIQRLRPLHGDLRVRPVAASLTPGSANGQRPPDRLQTRQVVATRPPQDTISRLHARGVQTAAPAQRPAPRIVQSRPPHAPTTGGQASVAAQAPGTVGRQQPPPVPGRHPPGGAGLQERAAPPPPPNGQARQPQSPAHQQAAPQPHGVPPPPPQGRAPQHAAPQSPSHEQAAPQEHSVPPPPPQGRAAQHAAPQSPSHEQAAPQEHSASPPPPQSRAAPHAVPQSPSHQQPAPQQRRMPPQASHPPAAPAEPSMPRQPQAPPAERSMSRQPSHQQAAPQPHAAQQQPGPLHATPQQQHAAPSQPAHGHPAPAQQGAHEESKPEH